MTDAEPPAKEGPLLSDMRMGVWDLGTLDSTSPIPRGLVTTWRQFGRRDLTIDYFRRIPSRRLAVCRLRNVAYTKNDQGEEVFSHFLPETVVYLVPEGIPPNFFYVKKLTDIAYIDSAVSVLFRRDPMVDSPILRLGEFWRYPSHPGKADGRLLYTDDAVRHVQNQRLVIQT